MPVAPHDCAENDSACVENIDGAHTAAFEVDDDDDDDHDQQPQPQHQQQQARQGTTQAWNWFTFCDPATQ